MRIADDETCDFEDIRFHTETAKAFLCEIGNQQFWVPKSQITDYEKSSGRRFFILTVRLWWAEKSGALDAYEDAEVWHRPSPPPKSPPPPEPPAVVLEFMTDINQLWQAVKEDAEHGLSPDFPRAYAIYRKLALKYHPDRDWN